MGLQVTIWPWGPFFWACLGRGFVVLWLLCGVETWTLGVVPAPLRSFAFYGAVVFCISSIVQQLATLMTAGPRPDLAVSSETGAFFDDSLSWAVCSMRGWRDAMEDAHVTELLPPELFPETAVFAVLDGHGGGEVSSLVSQLLTSEVRACGQKLQAAAGGGSNSLQEALETALPQLDSKLRAGFAGMARAVPLKLHPFALVGSTACVAAVDCARREVVVANVGDSRALLIRNGKAVALSSDHKPEDSAERSRIRAAGGEVRKIGPCWRVDGSLNLSRALGDFRLKANSSLPPEKQKVISVPDSTRTAFKGGPQEILIVACDGVFERFSNQDIADFVWLRVRERKPLDQVGRELLHACCARSFHGRPLGDGTDNETVILIRLPPPPLPLPAAGTASSRRGRSPTAVSDSDATADLYPGQAPVVRSRGGAAARGWAGHGRDGVLPDDE